VCLPVDEELRVHFIPSMRFILLLLSLVLWTGCQHSSPTTDAARLDGKTPELTQGLATNPTITPIISLSGSVVYVNPISRYIVLDFYTSVLPQTDQRFNVYRRDLKVGEIKISREARNHLIAADIMAGEVEVGDVARPD
jgi:hypothetical protein